MSVSPQQQQVQQPQQTLQIAISTEGRPLQLLTVTPELLNIVEIAALINSGTSERFNLSFSGLLLALYYSSHGMSEWLRQYIAMDGIDFQAILKYRNLTEEAIINRLREGGLIPMASPRPHSRFPNANEERSEETFTATISAYAWLENAQVVSTEQKHARTGMRHLMAAVIFTKDLHEEQLKGWRFDRAKWAHSFLTYIEKYLPDDVRFFQRLRDGTFSQAQVPPPPNFSKGQPAQQSQHFRQSVPETGPIASSSFNVSEEVRPQTSQAQRPPESVADTMPIASSSFSVSEELGQEIQPAPVYPQSIPETGPISSSSFSSPANAPQAPPSPAPSAPPRDPVVTGPPGYNSEFCGLGGNGPVTDSLKVEDLARRFAELIVLRETRLPLAVGLFANWGSGKSHFMNLIDRNIKTLADKTLNPPPSPEAGATPDDPWCREMVPIYFNAWHYSDANLWASLVAEVFDALFARLDKEPDQLGYLQTRLQHAGGVTALASEEAGQAKKLVIQANTALQTARAESESTGQAVLALKNGLATLLPELSTEKNREEIVELLGIQPEIATLNQLDWKRSELTSTGGQITALWNRATARKGRRARLSWLTGALAALAVSYLANRYLREHAGWIAGIGPWVRAALISVIAFLGWLAPFAKQVKSGLAQLEKWQKKAEEAQARMPQDKRLIQAEEAKSSADARATAAEAALAAARAVEVQLTQSIEDLSPQRRLTKFIEARARSADYRGQLGLVSLARRDFSELSRIFADAEALNSRVKDHPDQADKLRTLNSSVDRVVLFIDDLDRCDPDKVVDVLQAVHLLLAYPLFVVVVGVDQRCLRQSLRLRFNGLLSSAEPADLDSPKRPAEGDEIPATPLDYLEKIFHIPFHLPPMSPEGFGDLVESLTTPPVAVVDAPRPPLEPLPPHVGWPPGITTPSSPSGPAPQIGSPAGADRLAPSLQSEAKFARPLGVESKRAIGSVPLERWERDALKGYSALIRTPRGVVRLLNTYRLVRAGIPVQEWDAFRGTPDGQGESSLAMLLLAVAAGEPSLTRQWFGVLKMANPGDTALPGGLTGDAQPNWSEFCGMYAKAVERAPISLRPAVVKKWLDRVERFTF